MAYQNGRLPRSALAPITQAVNGEQAYLEKHAAHAFMAMNAESEAKFGVTIRVSSARVAYRSFADQEYFWHLYEIGAGALAAKPGTSNHGLGLAVDLATPQMRQIVDEIGEKYGWSKKWSDAPSEWWHVLYKHGVYDHPYAIPRTLKPGTHGRAVKHLKRRLRAHRVDRKGKWRKYHNGFYGPSTVRAVKRFQRRHNLKADGIVGPTTWRKLLA